MPVKLKNTLLWGHSHSEFVKMFNLSDDDLNKRILVCGAGPSSFNAESYGAGRKVISCDALYRLDKEQLEQELTSGVSVMLQEVANNHQRFNWVNFKNQEELAETRQQAAVQLLLDYDLGKQQQRYVGDELPDLDFTNNQFDLALSSHFLFNNTLENPIEFHINSIKEMCRVALEARIFPLLDAVGEISPLLGPTMMVLQQQGYGVEVSKVDYEFQKGGNAMMRIWLEECKVD